MKLLRNTLFTSSVVISLLSIPMSAALAQDRPPPRTPPAEAFAACEGKSAGTACTVTFGDRSLTGTCLAPPPDVSDTRLFCAPPRPEGPPR